MLEKCYCETNELEELNEVCMLRVLSISGRKCHLSKWHDSSSVGIHPACQSAPDQFSDSLSSCGAELNGIIGRLSGFLGRYSFAPWYQLHVAWNPATAPRVHTHTLTGGECLSHWTSWVTVRRTDVSNGSEQTPLPSNSHRHTLLNKRQTTHTHTLVFTLALYL